MKNLIIELPAYNRMGSLMTSQNIQKRRIETFRIVAIYSLFGLAWIYGSDTVLGWLVHDSAVMVKIAVIKGSLFILCTATLLYFLISRFVRQLITAESAHLESLTNYQTIFNTTNEAIFVHDARSGYILDVNDRMLEIYGYTREEALSVEIGDLSEGISPYSQAEAAENLRKALFEGPQVFEWHSRRKNGDLFWSEVSLRRITIHESDRVIAVVRDISERKQLDDALQMREKRHQTILDSAMDGFWVVNHDGQIMEVNDAYCHMSGYSKQELLTMGIADFDVNETSDDTVAHNDKITAQGSDRFIARHRRKDGTVYDVEVSATFVPVEGGILVGFMRDITEQKRLEESLRESKATFKAFYDLGLVGLTITSPEKGWIKINDCLCTLLGYTEAELRKLTWEQLTHPDDIAADVNQFERVLDGKIDGYELEKRFLTKSGGIVFTKLVVRCVRKSDLSVDFIAAMVEDITERKQIENELRDADWKFKALFENGPIGVAYHRMMYDESGKPVDYYFIDANENYLALTGVDPRGKTVTQAFPGIENDPFDWIGVFGRVAKTGETIHFEQYLAANDRWYDCVGFQYRPDHFVASFVEITARKKAEQQLEVRKRLLDTLLANLPVGVFMVEAPSGKPLIANEKALELLGRGILPDTNKENLTEVYEAYKYGTHDRYPVEEMPIVRGMYGESTSVEDLLVIRPDGTSKLLGISGTPVLNADNHPWASIVCFQDITDRKELENEQLKMQKLESLGVLAGGIAHDFNNILTGVMGNISLAKRFIDDSHKSFNALEGAEKASLRATELAHQLLTFARGGEPVKKVVSIQGVVNESVSLVLHGSNVMSTVDIPDSIHPIEADEGQISQVFHNILINATQAMPGGGLVTISARNRELDANNSLALPPGPYACISFTDVGCGIVDADLNKIFDPYFTTKVSGNGLGLASCRSIIIRHGGHIGVTSRVGTGTTFTIHLPSIGEPVAEYQVESVAQISKDHIGGAILVMDDEEIIRDLAAAMLEELGYQVTTCGDGATAIRLCTLARESGTPFLSVIMDLTIPGGMGGKEAAKEILAIDPTACLIVSSGYSNDPIMSDFRSYGFNGAIEKPYRISELEQLLRSSLHNRTDMPAPEILKTM
jgi:PAS domain S-box-containing protein